MDHLSILMERGDNHKEKNSFGRRLATGAIVGIVIACLVVFLGMLLCCYCCCFRRRRQRSRELEGQHPPHMPSKKEARMMDKLRRMMRGKQTRGAPPPPAPAGGPEPGSDAQNPNVQKPNPVYR